MSPRNARNTSPLSARDTIIRHLAPSMMRAFNVDRAVAIELLASCSEEQRSFIWGLRARAVGISQSQRSRR